MVVGELSFCGCGEMGEKIVFFKFLLLLLLLYMYLYNILPILSFIPPSPISHSYLQTQYKSKSKY